MDHEDAGNSIDLKWLRSFVVVAEEASFTRAASRAHVAQPGVSAQVACAQAGFTPLIVFEASALSMVSQLATRGLGVAIVPVSAAMAVTAPTPAPTPAVAGGAATATAVPITSPAIRSRLELAWNSAPPANPAARVLAEHAQGFVRQLTASQDRPAHPSPPAPASR